VLQAAWHWGSDSSVESGRTLLYVDLPSAWVSVDGDLIFSPFRVRVPFWELWHSKMNE